MATANFNFDQLSGSETAGYTSINNLINDIDTKLDERVIMPNMIIIWDTGDGAVPSGWSSLGATVTGLPTLTSTKVYIKKGAV